MIRPGWLNSYLMYTLQTANVHRNGIKPKKIEKNFTTHFLELKILSKVHLSWTTNFEDQISEIQIFYRGINSEDIYFSTTSPKK